MNYPSAKGNVKCRVLYNDPTNGLQLVSVNPVEKVMLGSEVEPMGDKVGVEKAIDKEYWLASHHSEYDSSHKADAFSIRYVKTDGKTTYLGLVIIYHPNRFAMQGYGEKGLRVIFKLSPDVKILDGQGTEGEPFEIGL